jgi:hypothetical protein
MDGQILTAEGAGFSFHAALKLLEINNNIYIYIYPDTDFAVWLIELCT